MSPKNRTTDLLAAARAVLAYPTPVKMAALAKAVKALGHDRDRIVHEDTDHYAVEMADEKVIKLIDAAREVIKLPCVNTLAELARRIRLLGAKPGDGTLNLDTSPMEENDRVWVDAFANALNKIKFYTRAAVKRPTDIDGAIQDIVGQARIAPAVNQLLAPGNVLHKSVVPPSTWYSDSPQPHTTWCERCQCYHTPIVPHRMLQDFVQAANTEDRYHKDAQAWAQAHFAMIKLERLREKRSLIESRGSDTTRFAAMIEQIEQELKYIDALMVK